MSTATTVLDIYCTAEPGERAHLRGGGCWCDPEMTTFEPQFPEQPTKVIIDHYAKPRPGCAAKEPPEPVVDKPKSVDVFAGQAEVECCGRTFQARGYHGYVGWHRKHPELETAAS